MSAFRSFVLCGVRRELHIVALRPRITQLTHTHAQKPPTESVQAFIGQAATFDNGLEDFKKSFDGLPSTSPHPFKSPKTHGTKFIYI
jgi:hypothetical protein